MTYLPVQRPFRGNRIKAGWGASVADALAAHQEDIEALRGVSKWETLRKASGAAAPFTVRLHKTDDDPDGKWEIYLPAGCCPGDVANVRMEEVDGHGDDAGGWYLLPFPDWDDVTNSPSETKTIDQLVEVAVHLKRHSAKDPDGLDAAMAGATTLCYAGCRDARPPENSEDLWEWTLKDCQADYFRMKVAEVARTQEVPDEDGEEAPDEDGEEAPEIETRVRQGRSTPIDVVLPSDGATSAFNLVWIFNAPTPGKPEMTVASVFCTNQSVDAAGIQLTGANQTYVTDAETVHAVIDGTDMASGTGKVTVVADMETSGGSEPATPDSGTIRADLNNDQHAETPFLVILNLYTMKNNVVTGDWRGTSLANVQLLHA